MPPPDELFLPVSAFGDGHPKAVDLGLSVKWASCNVGATSPEDYGGYYAWGETTNGEPGDKIRDKYNLTEGNTVLDLEDDVAHVLWGDGWRIPTVNDIAELLNECSWMLTTVNGVGGYKVTGPNGNFIFLPFAGELYDDGRKYEAGRAGYYHSSTLTLCSYSPDRFYYLYFLSDGDKGVNDGGPTDDYTIRPVYDDSQSQISITTGGVSGVTNSGATLSGIVNGISKSLTCGIIYGTSSELTSSNGTMKVVVAHDNEYYSTTISGLSANTAYYYRAFVYIDGEYKYGDVRSFKTNRSDNASSYTAVDLGLSVKWASCNVGATSPKESGGYYAWGETLEKANYSWSTYKWCNGSASTITKYSSIVDNLELLDLEDDVAHVQWGNGWRMPTEDEIEELTDDCDWTLTTVNGVYGFRITGPNGNSIFLPTVCYRYGEGINSHGTKGYYWSSTSGWGYGDSRHIDSYFYTWIDGLIGIFTDSSSRCVGFPVRPVTEK